MWLFDVLYSKCNGSSRSIVFTTETLCSVLFYTLLILQDTPRSPTLLYMKTCSLFTCMFLLHISYSMYSMFLCIQIMFWVISSLYGSDVILALVCNYRELDTFGQIPLIPIAVSFETAFRHDFNCACPQCNL